MKKRYSLFQNLNRFRKYYGWFCTAVLALSLATLIVMMGRIITPFLNSIIWGM
jgi:hypothetical protein